MSDCCPVCTAVPSLGNDTHADYVANCGDCGRQFAACSDCILLAGVWLRCRTCQKFGTGCRNEAVAERVQVKIS